MIMLTILTSAIYIIGLVPFKSIPLIPGFTEIRPANLFPVLFGLLFGPAGAWGSAIGNLVGDLFGTFSIGSIFGFAGNFFLAFIPYKIWGRLGTFYRDDRSPVINSAKKLIEFGIVTILSSAACAVIIAWGLDSLKLVPFASLSTIIMLNNTVMTMIFGPLVLALLYPRIKKWGLLWTDILSNKDITESRHPRFYSMLVAIGAAGGLLAGLAVSIAFAGQTMFGSGSACVGAGNIFVRLVVLPYLIILFFASSKL